MQTRISGLHNFFQMVRERPSMYVRNCSLDDLELICHGYAMALGVHGIDEFGTRFNQQFAEYLLERYGWSMCCGWARGIREQSHGDDEAFRRFFELVEEFRDHLRIVKG